jgi:hypothetical protein
MGPYAGVDYNSSYLMVNSVVGYPPSLPREGVGVGKISFLVEHIYICLLISKTGFLWKHKYREGGWEGV